MEISHSHDICHPRLRAGISFMDCLYLVTDKDK
jgi:hypothetical protein